MKPKLNFDDFKHGTFVINCKTIKEAETYLKHFNQHANPVFRLSPCGTFDRYKSEVCYNLNTNNYCNLDYYVRNGYTILNFDDFDWSDSFNKADLKNGDFVLLRNGDVCMVNADFGVLVDQKGGYYDLSFYNDDLTRAGRSFKPDVYDIVEVRRPRWANECTFDMFKDKEGQLVYERKEVEEMTLEEVCKALGKEIKIVKK